MGVNNDNPCPECGSVYSEYQGNNLFACRGCDNYYKTDTKEWYHKGEENPTVENKNDWGFAFPHIQRDAHGDFYDQHSGMSLRDYFAGQALAGFMSKKAMGFKVDDDAEYCYAVADAMLKERDK